MTVIATFGNCHAEALEKVLRLGLPDSGYRIESLANNPLTGEMRPTPEILATLQRADVAIFQPLDERHGALNAKNLRQSLSSTAAITFPRAFNSGVAALCGAFLSKEAAHGVFGGEFILQLLEEGLSVNEIKRRYEQGEIDFELPRRFDGCVEEMRRREARTDVVLADFIETNRRAKRLFLSHNHPATTLLVEICKQVGGLTGLPIEVERLETIRDPNAGELPEGYAPVSPHDAEALSYEFDFDTDWLEVGSALIDRIAEGHMAEHPAAASQEPV